MQFSDSDWNTYTSTLGKRESGSNTRAINQYGYAGAYQFGAQALEDVGLLKPGSSKSGNSAMHSADNWTIPGGYKTYLDQPEVQNFAVKKLAEKNYQRLSDLGVPMEGLDKGTQAGLLMASHLKGPGNAAKLFHEGVEASDANGTSNKSYLDLGRKAFSGENLQVLPKSDTQYQLGSDVSGPLADMFPRLSEQDMKAWKDSHQTPDSTWAEKFQIAADANTTMQFLSTQHKGEYDPTFNAAEQLPEDIKHLPLGNVLNTWNQSDFDREVARLREVDQAQQSVSGPLAAALTLGGAALDPLNYMMFAGTEARLANLGKVSRSIYGAALGSTGALAANTLHNNTSGRDWEDNSGFAALGGAAIGGLVGRFAYHGIKTTPEQWVQAEAEFVGRSAPNESTASAMQVTKNVLDEQIAQLHVTQTVVDKTLAKTRLSATSMFSQAENPDAQALANKLFDIEALQVKNLKGQKSFDTVQSKILVNEQEANKLIYDVEDAFDELRAAKTVTSNKQEFMEAIGDSIQSDVSSLPQHLRQPSKVFKDYFSELGSKLQKIYPEIDPKKFFPLIFDQDKVVAYSRDFEEKVLNAIRKQFPNLEPDLAALKASNIREAVTGAGHVNMRNQLRNGFVQLMPKTEESSGVLHLSLNDVSGYVEKNVQQVLSFSNRKMVPEVAFKEVLGSRTAAQELSAVRDSYDTRIAGAKDLKTAKRLTKEKKIILKELEGQIKYLGGQDITSSDLSAIAHTITYVAKGMGMIFSNIPDLASLGYQAVLSKLGFGDIAAQIAGDFTHIKLSKKSMRLIGQHLETKQASQNIAINDTIDPFATNKLQRSLKAITQGVGTFSGMNTYNNVVKGLGAQVTAQKMLKDFARWTSGKLPEKYVQTYLRHGIDLNDAEAILKQIKDTSTIHNGIRTIDEQSLRGEAGVKFRQALNRELHTISIYPGSADSSILMKTEIGRLLGKFMSYGLAFHNKVLIPGLQRPDLKFVGRLGAMVTMGMVAQQLYNLVVGKEIETDPQKLIMAGLSRGGIFGTLGDIEGRFEGLLGLGFNKVLGEQSKSSKITRDRLARFLGPVAGTASNYAQLIEDLVEKPWDARMLREVRHTTIGKGAAHSVYLLDLLDGTKRKGN